MHVRGLQGEACRARDIAPLASGGAGDARSAAVGRGLAVEDLRVMDHDVVRGEVWIGGHEAKGSSRPGGRMIAGEVPCPSPLPKVL
jgi:hypothetical protein